jgi:acyl-CoA thioester hydrolase
MTETSDAGRTDPRAVEAQATPYAARVALRWSDMDAYAHINNVQFLRLLEDARVIAFRDWFEGGGAGDRTLLDEGVLVSRHEIEYRRPLGFRHDPVEIQMWVSRVGGAGFDVAYIVTDPHGVTGADRPVYAVAETELALYDFARGAPRRIRPEERASLQTHLGEPAPFRRRRR